jgi:hypothetical protein
MALGALSLFRQSYGRDALGGHNRAMALRAKEVRGPRNPQIALSLRADVVIVVLVFEPGNSIEEIRRARPIDLVTFGALIHVRRFDGVLAVASEACGMSGLDHHLRRSGLRLAGSLMAVCALRFLIRGQLSA